MSKKKDQPADKVKKASAAKAKDQPKAKVKADAAEATVKPKAKVKAEAVVAPVAKPKSKAKK